MGHIKIARFLAIHSDRTRCNRKKLLQLISFQKCIFTRGQTNTRTDCPKRCGIFIIGDIKNLKSPKQLDLTLLYTSWAGWSSWSLESILIKLFHDPDKLDQTKNQIPEMKKYTITKVRTLCLPLLLSRFFLQFVFCMIPPVFHSFFLVLTIHAQIHHVHCESKVKLLDA